MAATNQRGCSRAQAADQIAAPLGFVVEAVAHSVTSLNEAGCSDEAGLDSLRRHYRESGEALADLIRSSHEEGWYDTSIDRLRELGIVDADEGADSEA